MAFLETMLNNLVTMDFFQLLFPFLLTLAIVYGVLIKGFEDRLGKGPIGLISILIAFFVMLYSSMYSWLWQWLTNISGVWLGIAMAILFLLITLALVGIKDLTSLNWKSAIIVLIVLYILAVGFLGAAPFGGFGLGSIVFNSELWTIVAFVIILAVVMWFLSREGSGGGDKKE
ncbi:MAG: hypothetical protein DRO99_00510 [Candidatus Aenigmatarchaeota archaeon]|nr:MAG: hypothetical protein DRO99_00510 [Candidatus Aenigmarchaeota archaeon]